MYYILSMVIEESVEQSNSSLNKSELEEWVKKLVVDQNTITLKDLKASAQNQALIFSFTVNSLKALPNYGVGAAGGIAAGSTFCVPGAIIGGIVGAILASTVDHKCTKRYSYQYDFINRFLNDFPSLQEELNSNKYCDDQSRNNNLKTINKLSCTIAGSDIITNRQLRHIINASHEYANSRLTNESLFTIAAGILVSGAAGGACAQLPIAALAKPMVTGFVQGASYCCISKTYGNRLCTRSVICCSRVACQW
jgi:hypothetical protein